MPVQLLENVSATLTTSAPDGSMIATASEAEGKNKAYLGDSLRNPHPDSESLWQIQDAPLISEGLTPAHHRHDVQNSIPLNPGMP